MIALLRHDGQVTLMSEECYKSLTKVYKQYVAVIKVKLKKPKVEDGKN